MKNTIKIVAISLALAIPLTVQGGSTIKENECSIEFPTSCNFTETVYNQKEVDRLKN